MATGVHTASVRSRLTSQSSGLQRCRYAQVHLISKQPDLQRLVRGFSPSLWHDVRQICGLFVKGYGHCWAAKVEPRVSRIGALLQGIGCAPGTSDSYPGSGWAGFHCLCWAQRREGGRSSTRSRMPVMRGLLPRRTPSSTPSPPVRWHP